MLDIKSKRNLMNFKMWMYRKVYKIPWTARMTNDKRLKGMNEGRELMVTVKQRI